MNYKIATIGQRFLNFLIDGTLCAVIAFIMGFGHDSIFILIIPSIYYLISEWLFDTTIGKKISKTQLVNKDGTTDITFETALTRTVARLIPFEALSFLSKNPVGWHDKLSETRVIKIQGSKEDQEVNYNSIILWFILSLFIVLILSSFFIKI